MPSIVDSLMSIQRDTFLGKYLEDVYMRVYDHGFAITSSGIEEKQLNDFHLHLESLQDLDALERSPYDKTHYGFNKHPDLDYRFYDNLMETPHLKNCLDLLVPGWKRGRYGGDRVKAGSTSHQKLHSDWSAYTSMEFGFAIAVSLALRDIPADHAAIRGVPWSCWGYKREPYADVNEDGQRAGVRLSLFRGELLIRDCRAAHAGAPNDHHVNRNLPGVQILSPQWLEHVGWSDEDTIAKRAIDRASYT